MEFIKDFKSPGPQSERDQRGIKEFVYEKGIEKGRVEGMKKGIEKGRAEGMQAVALNMLKEKVDTSFICKVTGLSTDEINKLKNSSSC